MLAPSRTCLKSRSGQSAYYRFIISPGCPAISQLTFRPNLKAKAMPHDISFQSLRVLIDGHDSEGSLVLSDGQLAAVIVRLDGEHHGPDNKGWWHLEAGFGKCDVRDAPLFKTPDEAGAWVQTMLMVKAT
jgi:hypothetical protein